MKMTMGRGNRVWCSVHGIAASAAPPRKDGEREVEGVRSM